MGAMEEGEGLEAEAEAEVEEGRFLVVALLDMMV
jgi:hypothetical protein